MHIGGDHNVRPARLQSLPGARQHFGNDRELRIGFGGQALDQREQGRCRHQRLSDQRQVRFPAACQRFGVGGQFIGGLQQNASALQQHTPNIREFCSVTGAVEKHHIQLFFQLLHGVTQGRRNPPQLVCRSGKAATPVYRVHDA
ncbi:hypothetical protein D3C72_1670960 [compost metagenome]